MNKGGVKATIVYLTACVSFAFMFSCGLNQLSRVYAAELDTMSAEEQTAPASAEDNAAPSPEAEALYDSGNIFTATSTETIEDDTSRKAEPAFPDRLSVLPEAAIGDVAFFGGDLPVFHIAALAVFDMDADKSPGIVFVTTGSLEVYHFLKNSRVEKVWSADYLDKYNDRGFAASAFQGVHKGANLLFVSINKFSKSFAYKWNGKEIAKAGRINGAVADVMRKTPVSLVSIYGKGVISFDGALTKLVDTTGSEPQYIPYPIKGDYYTACVLSWNKTAPKLSLVAAVSENGEINVFKDGQIKYKTLPLYGGQIICDKNGKSGDVIYTTTSSSDQDAVLTLSYRNDELVEIWRTPAFDGAVTALAAADLDRDGNTELAGILKMKDGRQRLFRARPSAPAPHATVAPPQKKAGTKQR